MTAGHRIRHCLDLNMAKHKECVKDTQGFSQHTLTNWLESCGGCCTARKLCNDLSHMKDIVLHSTSELYVPRMRWTARHRSRGSWAKVLIIGRRGRSRRVSSAGGGIKQGSNQSGTISGESSWAADIFQDTSAELLPMNCQGPA